jgi:hypothetical protein
MTDVRVLLRLREQFLVALTVITEDNIAFTARGPAHIIQEPMTEAPDYAAAALEADHIDDHRQAGLLVEGGIDRRWLDQDDQRRLSKRVRALTSTTT